MTDYEQQRHWAEVSAHAVQAIATEAKKRTLRAEVWANVYAAEYRALRSNGIRSSAGDGFAFKVDAARAEALTVADRAVDDFDTYCRRECL